MGNLSVMALILSVMALIAWLCIGAVGLWVHMGAYAGEMGSDMFSTTRSWAKATLDALSAAFVTYGWVSVALLSIFMVLQPAAAYSVAGIGHRTHAPAIYSAMHLRARAKLDPAVWAPVESAYGGEHNSSKSAKWAWGEVRGYASDIMLQIAGRAPLGTAVSQREMEYCVQADSGMASGRYFVDSCCSKTIVRDRHLLKNVHPLTTPARVAGLSGIKTIDQQADLHLLVTDVNGKRTVIILEGVYYDRTVKYNLVSVAELAGLNYEARFSKQASSVRGAAGIVPLIHTCNVYMR